MVAKLMPPKETKHRTQTRTVHDQDSDHSSSLSSLVFQDHSVNKLFLQKRPSRQSLTWQFAACPLAFPSPCVSCTLLRLSTVQTGPATLTPGPHTSPLWRLAGQSAGQGREALLSRQKQHRHLQPVPSVHARREDVGLRRLGKVHISLLSRGVQSAESQVHVMLAEAYSLQKVHMMLAEAYSLQIRQVCMWLAGHKLQTKQGHKSLVQNCKIILQGDPSQE